MSTKIIIVSALLAAICAPAWAITKCTGADGKVAFQDAPCSAGKAEALTVRPASGNGSPPPLSATAETAPKKQTEAQRIEAQIAQSQANRRKQELEVRLVPGAQMALTNHRTKCDQETAALQAKKSKAANNLAGATWEASISAEMSAVATRCDTRARELKDDLDTLKKECQALGGCK